MDEYISRYRPNWKYEFETTPKLEVAFKILILVSSNDVPDFFVYEDGKMLDNIIQLDAIINFEENIKKIGLTIENFMLPSAIQSKWLTSSYDTIYLLPTSSSLKSRKKDSTQKAALREMMGNHLEENNVKVKGGTDVNPIMRAMFIPPSERQRMSCRTAEK